MGETSGAVRAGAPPPMPLAFFGFSTALMGIAFYLIIEVNLTVQRFFKKRSGLYFWCLLIASWGTCIHTISFIIQWWVPGSPWVLCAALGQFGWTFMVTAQSLVLYSRLHLVIRSHRILRGALIMIITTSIAVEVPNWVTSWFAYDTDPQVTKLWTPRDDIMLRISQLVIFLQESSLSVLYIWGTVKILSPNDKININRVKWDLIAISSFTIATDLVNVVLTYTGEHYAKEPIQNFSYAFKLRVEFVVLNQLMAVTSQSRASNYNGGARYVKDSGWNSSSSGGIGYTSKAPGDRRRINSTQDSRANAVSPRPSETSPYSLAELAYGPNPNAKSLRHQTSESTFSGGDAHHHHELEKSRRARFESSPKEINNDACTARHDSDPEPWGGEERRFYSASGKRLHPFSKEQSAATARSNEGTWWDRLLRRVDPSYDERWERDLSRV